jgi:hypothetical protein
MEKSKKNTIGRPQARTVHNLFFLGETIINSAYV